MQVYRRFRDAVLEYLPDERLGSPEPTEITHLKLSSDLAEFYRDAAPVDCYIPMYGNPLYLFGPAELESVQAGYREANQFTDVLRQSGDWQDDWIAIGEIGGDPIIAITNIQVTPILFAHHGEGRWDPVEIAPTFSAFIEFLTFWIEDVVPYMERYFSIDGPTAEVYSLLRAHGVKILGADHIDLMIEHWVGC